MSVEILFGVYFLLAIVILVLLLKSRMTFGYGLGDVFFIILFAILVLILTLLTAVFIAKDRNTNWLHYIWVICLLVTCLQLTIFRGLELPWNGKIFFRF